MPKQIAGDMSMTDREWRNQKLVGAELRRLRERMGMTRAEMAASMGEDYSERLISQYEDGVVPMEIEPFFAMVDVLHANVGDLSPRRLMTRHVANGYLEMDEESRNKVDHIIDEYLKTRHGIA